MEASEGGQHPIQNLLFGSVEVRCQALHSMVVAAACGAPNLDQVKRLGALGEDEDAVAGGGQSRHQAVQQLPLGGHADHLALLLLLGAGVVQQVRVVAHLHRSQRDACSALTLLLRLWCSQVIAGSGMEPLRQVTHPCAPAPQKTSPLQQN